MPQIEKPDDLQSIANLTRFFCMHYNRLPCIKTSKNRPLHVTQDCHLQAKLKNRTFVMREDPVPKAASGALKNIFP
ncbi:hypothetical protein PSR59_05730 [Ligilactobacillus ruminis]|uniref:Uncharacterized protein n=1 Tax=Ligilactobacillus ruminis TaxID=1623 RepID=A0AAQ2XGU7_9LACO|nr:hypothetical protein [Ligilactobacillus ruminis]WDC79746.1 hypothetical protein PSR47_08260 [Ligilactobacillus ruminis]WDC81197.1 hypothetical protein PSR59_05730 [Ligilactobacillus ruminis]